MEEKSAEEKLAEKLNGIYTSKTQDCSTICRQIAFALAAVVWAILFKEEYGNNWQHEPIMMILLLLVVYFLIDVLQYFVVALRYRRHYIKTIEALSSFSLSEIQATEAEARGKINRISFYLFFLKIVVLLLSVIGLICVTL